MGKRLFILAEGPLPGPTVSWQRAYGLRTWQILSVIEDLEDWTIRMILIDHPKYYELAPVFSEWKNEEFFGKKIECLYLDKDASVFWKRLKMEFNSFEPEVCLGVNNLASYFMAKLKPKVPFWADLNGWLMAEAQSAAYLYKSDAYLKTLWKRESTIVKTADHFSTVSNPQSDALYGELASLFRLNQWTENWPFISVIPNGNALDGQTSDYKLDIPQAKKIIFFSGSYNTWLDEETLFNGIDSAMDFDKHLHFVSTGGQLEGESNTIFKSFVKRVKASKYKERYHFLGYLSNPELHSLYRQVDLAINFDRPNLESYFGARNRINEWAHFRVPIFTTVHTEVAQDLLTAGACMELKTGDAEDLKKKILDANKESLQEMTNKAHAYSEEHYLPSKTVLPLQKWLLAPEKAPDFNQKLGVGFFAKLGFRIKKDGVFFLLKWLWRKIK